MSAATTTSCPCHSGRKYKRCCAPLHRGAKEKGAAAVMRARFSAYSLALCNYIISTTHPKGPHFQDDRVRWHLQLQDFASQTLFEGLELLEEKEGPLQAQVAFRATLSQQGCDASFSERSLFVLHENRWLYHSGEKLTARAH